MNIVMEINIGMAQVIYPRQKHIQFDMYEICL